MVLSFFNKDNPNIGAVGYLNGRILSRRRMGKASFVDILYQGGKVQLFANSETRDYDEFISLPTGAFVSVHGEIFLTKTNHPTLKVDWFTNLSATSGSFLHGRASGLIDAG